MTNPATIGIMPNPVKKCLYGCGKLIVWDSSIQTPKNSKWRETDSGIIHDLARCCHVIREAEEEKKK